VLEPHVLASLNAVIANLERLAGKEGAESPHPPVDLRTGPLLLRDHARLLLGPTRRLRSVRIMVTMPSEAATDEQLLIDLLRAGMDVMRINCAHDDPETWRRMVENLARPSAWSVADAGSRRTWPARSCAPARSLQLGISCASNQLATSWVACERQPPSG